MRFRLQKKHEHLQGYLTGDIFNPLKRAHKTAKDAKYMTSTSLKRFNSPTEEESFRIQAELSRSNALLHEVMIPPR
jgi:hypothetical protein